MDLIAVDITDIPNVGAGEAVVLLGAQGDEQVGATELAALAQTVSYEIVTRFSDRVPRVFDRSSLILEPNCVS